VSGFLLQAAIFLAAAAIAAPLAKRLQISSVIGYLAAGLVIGPYGLGQVSSVYEVESILQIAEFGVVLLLFLIGLELRPKRLWTMRQQVFGLGAGQVGLTALLLWPIARAFGLPWLPALFVALALALSSTAFVLQVLDEKGELTSRHGRAAFSILLFQDLAAIPLLTLVPLFALAGSKMEMDLIEALEAILIVAGLVLAGRFVLNGLYHLVALTKVREAMTASALLTVVGVALLMEQAGLSAALGAFIAGVLLAESAYRHQIQADLAPFEGLLLGLFFTAIGMSFNLELIATRPLKVIFGVALLVGVKAAALYALARFSGHDRPAARRLAVALAQGGEFAFVLLTAALGAQVVTRETVEVLSVIVTLSMLLTPLLLLLDEQVARREAPPQRAFDPPPDAEGHVVIAGFGRFGQIAARVLRARRIPFTALDVSPEQVDFVARSGNKIYYGDASRLDILEAADTAKARAFVLAIDEVEASLRTAAVVRAHFPHVPLLARARNRQHAHRLMDLGVTAVRRETFLAALALTEDLLHTLGFEDAEVAHTISTFREHDRKRLYDDYALRNQPDKLNERARAWTEELEQLFAEDRPVADPQADR